MWKSERVSERLCGFWVCIWLIQASLISIKCNGFFCLYPYLIPKLNVYFQHWTFHSHYYCLFLISISENAALLFKNGKPFLVGLVFVLFSVDFMMVLVCRVAVVLCLVHFILFGRWKLYNVRLSIHLPDRNMHKANKGLSFHIYIQIECQKATERDRQHKYSKSLGLYVILTTSMSAEYFAMWIKGLFCF